MDVFDLVQKAGLYLDLFGVLLIVGGAILSTAIFLEGVFSKQGIDILYKNYRRNLARSILLGLEFLVAGDIIRSVTGDPSFTSIIILAIIVLIRSFLGIEFEMEVEGKWPWQRGKS